MDVGIAVLCEEGWPGVTTRAVSERAESNPGLIHYHYGGLAGLHAAIFRQSLDFVISPLVAELLDVPDERAALTRVGQLLSHDSTDGRTKRLAVELLVGAVRDPALGTVLRDELRQARARIADRLGQLHPDWSATQLDGVAALVVASIDGLFLHHIVDPALPVDDVLSVTDHLLGGRP